MDKKAGINFRIATINVNGFNGRQTLYDMIKQKKIDILCIQETHIKDKDGIELIKEMKDNGARNVFLSAGTNMSAGVGIILGKKLKYVPTSLYIKPKGRVIKLDIQTRS